MNGFQSCRDGLSCDCGMSRSGATGKTWVETPVTLSTDCCRPSSHYPTAIWPRGCSKDATGWNDNFQAKWKPCRISCGSVYSHYVTTSDYFFGNVVELEGKRRITENYFPDQITDRSHEVECQHKICILQDSAFCFLQVTGYDGVGNEWMGSFVSEQ